MKLNNLDLREAKNLIVDLAAAETHITLKRLRKEGMWDARQWEGRAVRSLLTALVGRPVTAAEVTEVLTTLYPGKHGTRTNFKKEEKK